MWWKKITFHNFFLAGGVLDILTIVGILAIKSYLPPVIPLYYGKPSGTGQLAATNFIFIIPAIAIFISLLNLFISSSTKDEFIKKILAVTSLIVSLMATITVTKIVLLVGFF